MYKYRNKRNRLFNRICLFSLSLSIFATAFTANVITVKASTAERLMEEMEARKSLPVESNQIENWPAGPSVGAQSAIVMEANTGVILYSKNIHEKLYPASTTKILTCLVAVESSSLDETVTFSHDAVFSIPVGSSNMGMDQGQSINMEECLYGILVGSANEVANAAAEHIGGSVEAFAEMMNQKANELGCVDSHFVNPHGLHDDNHYTSAYDLATIGRAFFQNELLAKISGTASYHFEPTATQPDDFILRTHNKLINHEYPLEGLIGGKTGYTDNARQTLVTCAERDGMKLICVVMKEESPSQFTDTVDLLNYGFSNFEAMNIAQNETKYNIDNSNFFQTENDIFGSSRPILALNNSSYLVLPKTAAFEDVESTISYDVEAENQIAKIDYTYHDVYVGSTTVDIASSSVSPYDFESEAEKPLVEEEPEENLIFVNIKKLLLFVLAGAGILIFLLFLKSLIQNYSFSKRRGRGRRSRRRSRRKYHTRRTPRYKDSD